MSIGPHPAMEWMYRGVWGILAPWFRVPTEPPTLPFHDAAAVERFRPAPAYLRYLKLRFWVFAAVMTVAMAVPWLIAMVAAPIVGVIVTGPILLLYLIPVTGGYLALHLRFDTTWYVLTDRSLRIRRGIWIIRETTITFENVQNVVVQQGPLQRFFGVSNVVVQTAGGGSKGPHGEDQLGPHAGMMEGLADAARIRDLVMARLTRSKTAGLGDEGHEAAGTSGPGWTTEHIAVLREIRDRVRVMASG